MSCKTPTATRKPEDVKRARMVALGSNGLERRRTWSKLECSRGDCKGDELRPTASVCVRGSAAAQWLGRREDRLCRELQDGFPTLKIWDVALDLADVDIPENDSGCSTARC